MKPKLLLMVHFEPAFREHMSDELVESLATTLVTRERFDWHIHFSSRLERASHIHEIDGLIDDEYDWGWGYEHDMFDDDEDENSWIINAGMSEHDLTWVPPELRGDRFKSFDIFLAGGFSTQCLASMQAVLRHTKHEYTLVPEFIYHYNPHVTRTLRNGFTYRDHIQLVPASGRQR